MFTRSRMNKSLAAIGLLALTYGLSTGDFLVLPTTALNLATSTFNGLELPAPVPAFLHPVLDRYLKWRERKLKGRPDHRFVVTQSTHGRPPNPCFFTRIFKPYGVSIRQLRATALTHTILHGHLKLLTVHGMSSEGMRRYQPIARLAQNTRKVEANPNLWK